MNIFFQFPPSFDEDKRILQSFKSILEKIKKDNTIKVHYSKENFEEFKQNNEQTEVYLTDEIKVLRQLISTSNSYPVSVRTKDISYIQWNLDTYTCIPCNQILQKIAEALYSEDNFKLLLVNLEDAISTCRNKVLIFRDAKHLDFPDTFLKIEFVTNEIEFLEWLKTNHIRHFSLRDEKRFEKKPQIIIKGATVYYELEEKRYWHLDTFHDYIEYEVYDRLGVHIGTANEEGELNFLGRKGNRSLPL